MAPPVVPVGGIGGVGGGGDVQAIADLWRNQLLSSPSADGATGTSGAAAARGADFAGALGNSITGLEGLDKHASSLAVQAATGDLKDVHDYVIAATEAQLAAQLTTTVRTKAVDAFNEIMRMPL
jgi:flagellar hook-basal body complex protein FliE